MNYWLVKADPDTDYSINDLQRDGTTTWDGVHNFQAINAIKAMQPDDEVYFYHSQKEKRIVGLARVSSEPYENTKDPRKSWAVELSFAASFDAPITLARIKAQPGLEDFLLVRHSRLSVMPVSPQHKAILDAMLNG